MIKTRIFVCVLFVLLFGLSALVEPQISTLAQGLTTDPPSEPVKLIFIHHSSGENWLTDGNGDLGRTLAENNYFVSDTNYGWGPNSIGDATDYYNWYDWFLGPESSLYLDALYNESGQNSNYTRLFSDPGGENRIVIFKSCFPNSDLAGNPDDPPADGEWQTVSHAKYIYTQLLDYFITRPDKLFIAITPPPLLDPTHAENARQFSRWMVEDWLVENNYPLNNVAVWDFHNILTHPDNHHRFQAGSVEYIIQNGNGTLHYDSDGDEHPNGVGNQKSTSEFVPMLNIFYNIWITGAPPSPPPQTGDQVEPEVPEESAEEETGPAPAPELFALGGVIDDFEAGPPPGTNGWEAFFDATTQSSLTCVNDNSVAHSGTSSLRIDFHVEPEGWATCPLLYENPPDFSGTQGLSFDYHADTQGLVFNVDVSGGTPAARATYFYAVETVPESVDGWIHVDLNWDQIVGVDWEGNAGTPINPAEINGFTFGFGSFTNAPNSGTIWIDNLSVNTVGEPVEVDQGEIEALPEEAESIELDDEKSASSSEGAPETDQGRQLCPGSTAMIGLVLLSTVYYEGRRWGRSRKK